MRRLTKDETQSVKDGKMIIVSGKTKGEELYASEIAHNLQKTKEHKTLKREKL